MGVQNIIKNSEEETPSSDTYGQNEPFLDETDDQPLVIDVYSDTSDTESFSELHDADDFLNIVSYGSFDEYDTDDESPTHLDGTELCSEGTPYCHIDFSPVNTLRQEIESEENKRIRRKKTITGKSRRSSMGKKKARRFENARQLSLMVGEDGYENDNDFMPFDCPFRFSQILEDTDLTNKVLNPTLDNIEEYLNTDHEEEHLKTQKTKPEPSKTRKLSPAEAFNNLDSSQKTFFKRRNLPMGMVQYLDTCVFSFFENNPTGTYISEPLTSFERMMLHSIAHYYELNSHSFDADNRIDRLTKVTNSFNYFDPPCLCLSRYLEEHLFKNFASNAGPKRRRYRRKQN